MINEQSWNIKKPCKPRYYEDEMQGFYIVVIFCHKAYKNKFKSKKQVQVQNSILNSSLKQAQS